jgi:hypothetical protein
MVSDQSSWFERHHRLDKTISTPNTTTSLCNPRIHAHDLPHTNTGYAPRDFITIQKVHTKHTAQYCSFLHDHRIVCSETPAVAVSLCAA